jgi:hypothetical protein
MQGLSLMQVFAQLYLGKRKSHNKESNTRHVVVPSEGVLVCAL